MSKTHTYQPVEERVRFHTKAVRYKWNTPDGTLHTCSTVVLSHTKRGLRNAVKAFWRQHTHVQPA